MGNTPNIRFKGFTDDWEQRKLFEIAEFNPKSELPETFEYVDLESVVGTEMVSHRTETRETAPSRAQRLAQTGDVFFQTVRPYQRNNYLFAKPDNNYVFSTGYAQMRPKIDAKFLMCFLQTDSFVKVVLDNCTGTSYPAINSNDLSNLEIVMPASDDEQIRIGSFITNLDNLITLHQRKCDETKELKKFMLQKMFPKNGEKKPEIRFEGFTDDWEQRKLSDAVEKLTGGASIAPDDYTEDGYRTIPKGAVNETGVANLSGCKYVSNSFFEKNISSKTSSSELVTSLRDLVPTAPNMGRIVRIIGNSEDFLMPQGVYSIKVKEKIDEDYLIAYSNSPQYRKIISAEKNGSTQVHIRNGEFLNIDLPMPCYEEQRLIGKTISNLDTLITLHQHKYEELQELKKFMLQNMFV